MIDNTALIQKLQEQLNLVMSRQDYLYNEINSIRAEIAKLQAGQMPMPQQPIQLQPIAPAQPYTPPRPIAPVQQQMAEQYTQQMQPPPITTYAPKQKSGLEKYIGENLITVIGVVITVIGVAIGAKYAIDKDLIGPTMRILLGYLVGAGLLGFALKLKKNYENFSAALLSGAMAIMYFVTYAAYTLYNLMPQIATFLLMVLFTVFTVGAAIKYGKQIIAHIGLVGAYAVPFLLSDGSGNVGVLFTYMTIINIGILVIGFKKYWKPLHYASFGLTWLMYTSWFLSNYNPSIQIGMATLFLSIFFLIFYATFLAYKLFKKEKFAVEDVILILSNAFIFYSLGYSICNQHATAHKFLGLFTLANACVHGIVSLVIYRQKLADRNLFYLVFGLVLVFITMAIPIQFNGNWVTLLWACEAALLFWIGRTKQVFFYEKLSYGLSILTFVSLLQDWGLGSQLYLDNGNVAYLTPFGHISFFTALLCIICFGFINWLNTNNKYHTAQIKNETWAHTFSYILPALLLVITYATFYIEITRYWSQRYALSGSNNFLGIGDTVYNNDYNHYKTIWLINYTLLYGIVLSFFNTYKVKNATLSIIGIGIIIIAISLFLTQGVYLLSELRESYTSKNLPQHKYATSFNLTIRYISYAFVALALVCCYICMHRQNSKANYSAFFEVFVHICILWIIASELIHRLQLMGSVKSHKLALSILFGLYALLLIVLGIWKRKAYLRISAMVLFGGTLIKVFMYDIAHLDTISKTIVLVSLGVLLLIISFLYNKYKHVISGEDPHVEITE